MIKTVEAKLGNMVIQDYIKIFREECGEHLPWEEARDLEAVFATKSPREIIWAMEDLKKAEKIPSQRFQKTLNDFYGEHSSF